MPHFVEARGAPEFATVLFLLATVLTMPVAVAIVLASRTRAVLAPFAMLASAPVFATMALVALAMLS